jgi:hypothetical protein
MRDVADTIMLAARMRVSDEAMAALIVGSLLGTPWFHCLTTCGRCLREAK